MNQPRLPASDDASPTARPRDEKTAFAVQLLWSVQPIDIAQIPQLAIFSAYTLYGAEGNRDGRRWYGVRLGFFTDAVSAKQVAHYVRSDFSTVSVVPVTARERERAKLAAARPEATPASRRRAPLLPQRRQLPSRPLLRDSISSKTSSRRRCSRSRWRSAGCAFAARRTRQARQDARSGRQATAVPSRRR